jgi:RNA polymerase sigma-70 factor (ECF subfamily)
VDDSTLVARTVSGDEAAFELLVRRHTDAVWRMAITLLADNQAAEEAVQDTFVKAYRGLAGFRGEAAVRTWLLAICHRCCIDHLRLRRARVVSLEQAREVRAREDDADLRMMLQRAVETLPADEREAFRLVHVLGLSREDAASVAGVPSSTMRSRVARARKRLAFAFRDSSTGTDGA